MFTFKSYINLFEADQQFDIPDDKGAAVFGVGNMNPPTRGHLALAQSVAEVAKSNNADAFLFTTQSSKGFGKIPSADIARKISDGGATKALQGEVRSPLSAEEKYEEIRNLFYKTLKQEDIQILQTTNYAMAMGKLIAEGYTDITLVAGSEYFEDPKDAAAVDQIRTFVDTKVNPYRAEHNGPQIEFKTHKLTRDPSASEGTQSYKGSKARADVIKFLAGQGGHKDEDFARSEFAKNIGWDREDADRMFDRIKKRYQGVE